MNVKFLLVSIVSSLLCQSGNSDTTRLEPGGRNVCKLPKRRPYLHDALSFRDWQTGRAEVMGQRCCEGWKQRGSSCPEAKCETPCEYGYCAAPDYCACQDGWTGPTCSKICPAISDGGRCLFECDCPSRMCDFATGSCACPLGYFGLNCSISCPVGYYGADCLLQCQCDRNNTCQPETGLCMEPENMSVVPSVPQLRLHFFRMAVLTGCGVAAILTIVSATVHAVRKRRTRRVFNVRKRTMSMTPISSRNFREENEGSRSLHNQSGRLHPHQGFPSPVASGSAVYVGMRDLLSNEAGTASRPVSSASTTISIVESLSESRDTIYEVRGDVFGSWAHQESNPKYTNSSMFSAETARRLNQKLRAIPSEVSVEDEDADDYNYPYADLGNLRLPVRADSNRLSTCSDDTEYVVVLKQEQGEATYASHSKGMLRGTPSGISNTDVPSTSTGHKTVPSLQDVWGDKGFDHYQFPRSPAVRRTTIDTACDQQFVRSYVTSIKSVTDSSTGFMRSSGHRQTRRVKEIVQCPPPPPPPGNSDTSNTSHVYVNDCGAGSGKFPPGPPKPKRRAPPTPKPRKRTTAEQTTTENFEEVSLETQTVERFI